MTTPSRLALAVVSLVMLCLAVARIDAQTGGRERTLFVSAVNADGEPVEGLGPDAFVIREDGLRREVLRVSRAIEPIDIALLADNSAAAAPAIGPLRTGIGHFVATMTPEHQVALIALADRPTIVVDYTSNEERLRDGVGRLFSMSTSGMTLLDALAEVSTGLRRREAARAALVVVATNGVDFSNRYSREVLTAITDAGAALHVITIGQLGTATDIERERALAIDRGTRNTGGQHVTLLAASAIDAALAKIARELLSQYKVVYGRPESLIPPETTEVTSARPGVTMRGTPLRGRPGE